MENNVCPECENGTLEFRLHEVSSYFDEEFGEEVEYVKYMGTCDNCRHQVLKDDRLR